MKHPHIHALSLSAALLFTAAGAEIKQVEKPEFFQTLVNPPCSYCIDESKRRAGELKDAERVLAWIRGQHDGGAVPFRFFLVPYRVISDSYGVWVYDADAGFVRGYEPSYDFSFHGWRNGVMVIQHKDGTLFSALSGIAFDGPRKGTMLKPLPTIETDWGYWLKAYPKTVAYHMFDKYTAHEMPKAVNSDSVSTRLPGDKRLPAEEMVIGVKVGTEAKAYPISLVASNKLIRDKVGGEELAVVWYEPTKTAVIFAARLEKGTAPEHLKLEYNPQIATAPFMDKETFTHWTIEGRAVEGPLTGEALVWLPGTQCKWFAWAAEYPDCKLYSAGEKRVENDSPMIAKLIEGERLDWDKLVKTAGYIVKKDSANRTVTVFADKDKKEHTLLLTPQTEFYVEGAWGAAGDFKRGQSVYLIATTDEHGELMKVHALADDFSIQSMSRPYEVKEYDKNHGRLVLEDTKGSKGPVRVAVNRRTHFFTHGEDIKTGARVFCNMTRAGGEWTAIEVADEASFEARRNERLKQQRERLGKQGLSGTVIALDGSAHKISVMVRRADSWYARSLKIGDLATVKGKAFEGAGWRVAGIHPDYSRIRVELEFRGSAAREVARGDGVAIFAALPDRVEGQGPPDLDRFRGRQERIDYFLSTVYCSCGMMGDSCAGHWNTLAACKLHGCGMPNLVSRQIGEWIDGGRSDAEILAGLIKANGTNMLRPHVN